MNPYQFYRIRGEITNFPDISMASQLSLLSGLSRSASTSFRTISNDYILGLQRIEVKHERLVHTFGRTTSYLDGNPHEITFSEFLESRDFDAYYHPREKVLMFHAPKEVCKSTHKAIKNSRPFTSTLTVEYEAFDFSRARDLFERYLAAWFHLPSANVSSAGLIGTDVENNEHFEQFALEGELTNIVILFEYDGTKHKVMLTKHSGVVLYTNFNDPSYELGLLLKVYETFFKPFWTT
jgi:hypothetical protein